MPTRAEVWMVADRLRAKPARVSIRTVRDALPRGGSYRVIGEHLAAWKAERFYQPRLELAQLTEGLQQRLVDFGKVVWEEALREATRQFEADRERLEGLRLFDQRLRDEALAAADAAEARTSAAEERATRLTVELAAAREVANGLNRKMRNVRATGDQAAALRRIERASSNEFWDRVLLEIHAQMEGMEAAGRGAGGFMPRELAETISQPLRDEAVRRGEDLGPGKLGSRMATRAKHGKLFVKEANGGAYRRLRGERGPIG